MGQHSYKFIFIKSKNIYTYIFLMCMNLRHITELENARTYGIIGIILDFIGSVISIVTHGFGIIVDIIGLIFIVLAMNDISGYYNDRRPFRYIIYSIISGIVVGAIAILLVLILALPTITARAPGIINSINVKSMQVVNTVSFNALGFLFLILLIVVIAAIIPTIFEYLAFNIVGDLTGIDQFRTGAILLLIGIILTVIIIGAIIALVGIILIAIGFNDLPSRARPRVVDTDFNSGNNF